ncbi:MAG: hypothetical protein NW226_14015 [Microscillaceae bacterium]|nr:hypothetical protein [Microscillaceae bacterium]
MRVISSKIRLIEVAFAAIEVFLLFGLGIVGEAVFGDAPLADACQLQTKGVIMLIFCDQPALMLDLYIIKPNIDITFIGYEDFYASFGINLMIFGGFVKVPGTVIYIKTRKPLDADFRVYF